MSDLVAFLRARLDEDEQVANAAIGTAFLTTGIWRCPGPYSPHLPLNSHEEGTHGEIQSDLREGIATDILYEQAIHIARWDPARALAEVKTKRLILNRHKLVNFTNADLGIHNADVCWVCHVRLDIYALQENKWENRRLPLVQEDYPCLTVRLLTVPYTDHPDYNPAWRPL